MFNHNFLKTLDILYIEHDKNTSNHFSNILKKLFSNVLISSDGKSGIADFENNKNDDFEINIVICDTRLPDMDGLSVLKKIREINPEIPFILTTSSMESEDLLEAIKSQVSDFLVKPLNAKNLVFSVEKICQKKYHEDLKLQAQEDLKDLKDVINEVALVSKTDIDGNIIFANDYLCEVSGFTKEELYGNSHDLIKDPKLNPIVVKELWESVKNGKMWEGKVKNISKDKEEFYCYLSVVPLNTDDNIDKDTEIMWIRFLSTEDELEQKEFKKKVAKNIHANRRINTEARDKIDELMNKVTYYKSIDVSLIDEKKRKDQLVSQISYFKKEGFENEKKLKEVSDKASIKIKKVLKDEKDTRFRKEKVDTALNSLTQDLALKNKSIKELNKEVSEQTKIIDRLKRSIASKENMMGLND